MPVPPNITFELGKERRKVLGVREGLWQGQCLPRHLGREVTIHSSLDSGSRGSLAESEGGWRLWSELVGSWAQILGPQPECVPTDRTRPDLLSEDVQRRFMQEVVQSQQAAVGRQLEDFRSKRLMGMTPWEQELAQLEAWVGRDRASYEARERHVAERLLTHLEEMQ